MFGLKAVLEARERIRPHILHTPLLRIPALDAMMGCKVYAKMDSTQITGSFKLRGAMNGILTLTPEQRAKGVVCPSSGNHAQAIAYASKLLGIDAKIVMPLSCNPAKLENVRNYGAQVVLVDIADREKETQRIIGEEGRVLIHAFTDPMVKAGQGTCGLEIMEDEPEIDAVVVPIGGGGLISGIAAVVKEMRPAAKVYGIEHQLTARYTNCRKLGKVVDLDVLGDTIADGTRGNHTDTENFEMINALVDGIFLAEEAWLRPAIRALIEKGHIVAEPSSCMGLAVASAGKLPVDPGSKVAFVLSGGNCDFRLIAQILAG